MPNFHHKYRKFAVYAVFLALASGGWASGGLAQEASTPLALPDLVVTATRIPTASDHLGSTVTVITDADIAKKPNQTLADILRDVPGLAVMQAGGKGAQASLFIRGTNSNHTKVLLDGMDIGDPNFTAFDFAHFPAVAIARIEILRGAQSGLYGADAVGGVVNIITKSGQRGRQIRLTLDGGAQDTFNQNLSLSGADERVNFSLAAAHVNANNLATIPHDIAPLGLTENGSYDNRSLFGKIGINLTDKMDIGLVAHQVDSNLAYHADGFGGVEPALSTSHNEDYFGRAFIHRTDFGDGFEQNLGIGFTQNRRKDINPPPSSNQMQYLGRRVKADYLGTIHVAQGQAVSIGAEYQRDLVDNTNFSAQIDNRAAFVAWQSEFFARFYHSANLRLDENSSFGKKATWRFAPSFWLVPEWTELKSSIGTGFKPPSLEQMYHNYPNFGFYGNPHLRPETSLGYDAGMEQRIPPLALRLGAVYFRNEIKDLIVANQTYSGLVNLARATSDGVENFIEYTPKSGDLAGFSLRGDYTYTRAVDAATKQPLLRRPKNKTSLTAAWQEAEKWSLGATLLRYGGWVDIDRLTYVHKPAAGFTTLDLAASYKIWPNLTSFARIDNVTDQKYQQPLGFLRPGFGMFIGITVDLAGAP